MRSPIGFPLFDQFHESIHTEPAKKWAERRGQGHNAKIICGQQSGEYRPRSYLHQKRKLPVQGGLCRRSEQRFGVARRRRGAGELASGIGSFK